MMSDTCLTKEAELATISMRTLSRNTSAVVKKLRRQGEPLVVLSRGRPIAALVALQGSALDDYLLLNLPEYVTSIRKAEQNLTAGRTKSVNEAFANLDKGTTTGSKGSRSVSRDRPASGVAAATRQAVKASMRQATRRKAATRRSTR